MIISFHILIIFRSHPSGCKNRANRETFYPFLQNHMKPFHPDDAIFLFLDRDVVINVDSAP